MNRSRLLSETPSMSIPCLETNRVNFEEGSFPYIPETDSFYHMHGDTNAVFLRGLKLQSMVKTTRFVVESVWISAWSTSPALT